MQDFKEASLAAWKGGRAEAGGRSDPDGIRRLSAAKGSGWTHEKKHFFARIMCSADSLLAGV